MGINSESDITANIQIGPTDLGMVRIYVQGEGVDCRWISTPRRRPRSPRS